MRSADQKTVDLTGDIYALALARAACLVPEDLAPIEASRAHSRHARNIAALALRIPAEGEVDQLAEQPEPADLTGIGTVASAALRAGARLLARKVRRDPIGAALAVGGVALFAGGLLVRKRPNLLIEGPAPAPFDDGDVAIHPLDPCGCVDCAGGFDDGVECLHVVRVVVLVPADGSTEAPASPAPASPAPGGAIAELVRQYEAERAVRAEYAPLPVGMNVETDINGAAYPSAIAWFVDEPPTDFPGMESILLSETDVIGDGRDPVGAAIGAALLESDEHCDPIIATYRLPNSTAHLVVLAHVGNSLFEAAPKVTSHLASFIKPLDEPGDLLSEVITYTDAQPVTRH
jgi:hypothetical protein